MILMYPTIFYDIFIQEIGKFNFGGLHHVEIINMVDQELEEMKSRHVKVVQAGQ